MRPDLLNPGMGNIAIEISAGCWWTGEEAQYRLAYAVYPMRSYLILLTTEMYLRGLL